MVKTLVKRTAVVAIVVLGTVSGAFATDGSPTPIPEPSLLALLVSAAGGAILYARNRRAGK